MRKREAAQNTKPKSTRATSCQPSTQRIIVVVWLPAIRQISVWIRVSGVLDTKEERVRRDWPQTGETVERIVSAIGSISHFLFWGLDPAPIPIIPLIPRGLPGPLGQRLPLPRAQKPAHSPRSTRALCMHVMCHAPARPFPLISRVPYHPVFSSVPTSSIRHFASHCSFGIRHSFSSSFSCPRAISHTLVAESPHSLIFCSDRLA